MAVKEMYRNIVKVATAAAGAVGVPGAFSFGLDVTALSAIWITMIISIADKSGHKVDKSFAGKLAAGLLAGVAAYIAGSKLAIGLLHLIPGAGTLAAIGVNSLLNALYTYKMGHALSNLFDKGGFDMSDVNWVAGNLMSVVLTVPTPSEIADVISMIKES